MIDIKKTVIIATAAVSLAAAVLVFLYVLPKSNLPQPFGAPQFGDETLLLVGSSITGPADQDSNRDPSTYPLMIFLNPRDWSLEVLDVREFPGLQSKTAGIVEAEPFTLNGEKKWAVITRHSGQLLILGGDLTPGDGLEVEFEERVDPTREGGDDVVRALFVADITGDGEDDIIVGTRPSGILRFYSFADGQWSQTTIDRLDGTIHDLLVGDSDGDGANEILLTTHIPLHNVEGKELPGYTPKILKYQFAREEGVWEKDVIAEYTELRPFSAYQQEEFRDSGFNFDSYYPHPRYIFLEDFDGDGSKELVTNHRGGDDKYLLSLKHTGEGSYAQDVVENELEINRQVVAVGDITNDGTAELIATTQSDDALLLYDYTQGKWEKNIIAEDLAGESEEDTVQFAYVLASGEQGYRNILYMVSGFKADEARFYVLSHNPRSGEWERELVATLPMGVQSWYITPAFANSPPRKFPSTGNIFAPCDEGVRGVSERYACYKDVALFAAQNGTSAQELFRFINEERKFWHFKEHAVGRAMLIVSSYNLHSAGEKCEATQEGCTSGFGHGLTLAWGEYTKETPPEDVEKNTDTLMTFMETFCLDCYHHLGHYYGALASDPEKALGNMDLCDSVENDSYFKYCIMGVVHQRLQDKLPSVGEFLATCKELVPQRKQEACYGYGSYFFSRWAMWERGIQGTLEVCREISEKTPLEWNHCYEAINEQLHNWGIEGLAPDISWCADLPGDIRKICIEQLSSPPGRGPSINAEAGCTGGVGFACEAPPEI